MTHRELFIEIFGQDVFKDPRTGYKTDRRTAAYAFMSSVLKMKDAHIAEAIGRSRTTVIHGRQRFADLLDSNDKIALAIWEYMNERIRLLYSDLDGRSEINKGELGVVSTKE